MISFLILSFQLLMAAFQDNKRIRQLAGFVAACLGLSLIFGGLTAWLSFPAYASMVPNPDPDKVWGVCIGVAVLMFFATSTIGRYIGEVASKVEPLISGRVLGFVVMIALVVGGFDAYKGYKVGAVERAAEVWSVQTFEEATPTLPYQEEIDGLSAEIDRLYSDEEKVVWKGRIETPWKNRVQAEKLVTRRDELYTQQASAAADMRSIHDERSASIRTNQQQGRETLQGLSILIYMIQILLAIPLGIFSVEWDMMDGVRDGVNSAREQGPRILGRVGSWIKERRKPTGTETDLDTAEDEEEEEVLSAKLGFVQGHEVEGQIPRDSDPVEGKGEIEIRTEFLDSSHPPFSKEVQPETYRSVGEDLYKRILREAPKVREATGTYNRKHIADRVGTTPKTVLRHLRVAWDKGDLDPE